VTPLARWLRLGLAATWLLDAVLQLQSFMFTKGFGQTLAATAPGNPAVVAGPINWSARLIEGHPAWTNAAFSTVQLLLAAGIAWRPTVKAGLAASVVWSFGIWWLGEGLGGVLNGTASTASGAPGAVILYALLAVLLWPADRDVAFEAARPFGINPARLLWLTLWGSLAWFAITGANRAPQGLHDMVAGMADGEPGWLAAIDRGAAALLAGQGALASAVLALVCCTIAGGIFLAAYWARAAVLLGVVMSVAIWVVGENAGAIFAGSATDPNSGLLLVLVAAAYWPGGVALKTHIASQRAGGCDETASAPAEPGGVELIRWVRPHGVHPARATWPIPKADPYRRAAHCRRLAAAGPRGTPAMVAAAGRRGVHGGGGHPAQRHVEHRSSSRVAAPAVLPARTAQPGRGA